MSLPRPTSSSPRVRLHPALHGLPCRTYNADFATTLLHEVPTSLVTDVIAV